MTTQSYLPPVDQLLTYGVCDPRDAFKYVEELELTADHIPDLICMAIDPDLNQANSDSLAIWAPVHAWRSLGNSERKRRSNLRGLASEAIEKVGKLHPETRSTCVEILTKEMDRYNPTGNR